LWPRRWRAPATSAIVFERALGAAIFVADAAHGMQDTIDCTFLYLGYYPLLRST
jgi:hypothetical protein